MFACTFCTQLASVQVYGRLKLCTKSFACTGEITAPVETKGRLIKEEYQVSVVALIATEAAVPEFVVKAADGALDETVNDPSRRLAKSLLATACPAKLLVIVPLPPTLHGPPFVGQVTETVAE